MRPNPPATTASEHLRWQLDDQFSDQTTGDGMTGPAPESPMTPGMVALFALSCGVAAANLYYAQPLLPQIAHDLSVSSGTATLVVTAAQVGYGIGLALVVPLGDILVRRRLVPGILVVAAAALLVASAAPDVVVLLVAVAVAGLCSVAAQILVPFAASLANDAERGRVVGTVMSGLLLGILLARTFSGLIAQAAGWRTVYVAAAAMVLALSAVLYRRLPGEGRREPIVYSRLLGSVVDLMRAEPVLRLRSAIGGLAFATFNVIWTSLAFLLAASPYHYSEAVIGLFGLLGAAGALAASFSGRLADRGLERVVTGGSLAITVGSIGLLALGASPTVGSGGRDRGGRPGHPGRAHPEPATHLRHRALGPFATQHRVHGHLLRRWRGRIGHHRAGLWDGRLARRHHPRGLLFGCRPHPLGGQRAGPPEPEISRHGNAPTSSGAPRSTT